MGFADNVLKRVFGSQKQDRLILDEGIIRRDARFKRAYETWKKEHAKEVIEEFRRNLSLSKKGLHDELRTVWLALKNAEGFRVFIDPLGPSEHDAFLLEYLKDLLLLKSYRVSNSFMKFEEVHGSLEQEEWYYLKPPIHITTNGDAMHQGFGNLKLELHQGKVRSIKLLATTYSGRMYQEPESFQCLLKHLFGSFSS